MAARLEFAHNVAGGKSREGYEKSQCRIGLSYLAVKQKKGVKIKKIIKEGDPIEEILKVIGEEKIDLVILRAHEESRIEHFLVGSSNDAIIRRCLALFFW